MKIIRDSFIDDALNRRTRIADICFHRGGKKHGFFARPGRASFTTFPTREDGPTHGFEIQFDEHSDARNMLRVEHIVVHNRCSKKHHLTTFQL